MHEDIEFLTIKEPEKLELFFFTCSDLCVIRVAPVLLFPHTIELWNRLTLETQSCGSLSVYNALGVGCNHCVSLLKFGRGYTIDTDCRCQ